MGQRKETILHRAALLNRREMVEFLLKQAGLSPKETDGNGNTPLHCAALGGHAEVGQLLVDAGADLEASNNEGDRPLHLAAGAGNLAFLKFLLQVGQSPWKKCEIISQAGATLDSTGCKGNTALHYAAQNAEADVMEELIGRGLAVGLTNFRWIGSVVHTVSFPSFFPGENQRCTLPLVHEALMVTSDTWSFC